MEETMVGVIPWFQCLTLMPSPARASLLTTLFAAMNVVERFVVRRGWCCSYPPTALELPVRLLRQLPCARKPSLSLSSCSSHPSLRFCFTRHPFGTHCDCAAFFRLPRHRVLPTYEQP